MLLNCFRVSIYVVRQQCRGERGVEAEVVEMYEMIGLMINYLRLLVSSFFIFLSAQGLILKKMLPIFSLSLPLLPVNQF